MPPTPLFPCVSRSYIESCQFSSWYPTFANVSARAVVIRPLSEEFRAYLEEDGVMVPEGSEDCALTGNLSDTSLSDTEDTEDIDCTRPKRHAFPQLDAQIREVINSFGTVFPKLNWTSPKDSSWVIPALQCTSPADVYLLLKSSDFISHDLDPKLAFEGCSPPPIDGVSSATAAEHPIHEVELVLKKWYSIDKGRELRCFVRNDILLAITQRDLNYYPNLNEQGTKEKILRSVFEFWIQHVRSKFIGGSHYVFDIHLTRDLSSAHILDFNPYHPKTDPLLFTYDEILQLLAHASTAVTPDLAPDFLRGQSFPPVLRTIDSPSHPVAARNAPQHQHNAIPFDVLQMSEGNDIATFSRRWQEELARNLYEN